MSDLAAIVYWWFFIFLLGVGVWPWVWSGFGRFWDRGWGLTKIAGLAVVGWLVWMVGAFRILPFGLPTIWGVIIGIFAVSWWRVRVRREEFVGWHKKNWKIVVFEESLFVVAFVAWCVVRGFQPDIEGLEKFMDFGFMNSVVRSTYFPPLDMWWAGSGINYYYFGHFLAGMLTKLSGIESSVTYNLAIAHLFGLGITGSFSIGSNLVYLSRRQEGVRVTKNVEKVAIVAGLLAALLTHVGGNWHTIYAFFSTYEPESPVPPWKLEMKWNPGGYWYPNATRFIPYTIHEFPIYSYVVADLHGHVSDIPFVILFLGMLVNLVEKFRERKTPGVVEQVVPFGFLLGVMMMANYWDLPIYGMIYGVTMLAVWWKRKSVFESLKRCTGLGLGVLGVAFATALGFVINFKQIAEGIRLVNAHSEWYQLAILYGWPIVICIGLGLYLASRREVRKHEKMLVGWMVVAWFLIVIPEIIYVKDIYIAEYHRANTMFKLVYQSFVLFSLGGAYVLSTVWEEWRKRKIVWSIYGIIAAAGVGLVGIYPWFAIRSYYGGLKEYKGLYGMHFLDKQEGDLAGIYWLKKNIKGQPVVLEAPGDSYTIFNRVSAMTGLPTVVGWAVHEWLWRGGYDQVGARISEVEKIYTSEDMVETKQLLYKYSVEYIFVGEKEREKYGDKFNEGKIASLGREVFRYGGTRIYRTDVVPEGGR